MILPKQKGVHFAEREQRWIAKIYYDGKSHHLGSYYTEGDAIEARKRSELILKSMQPVPSTEARREEREHEKDLQQLDKQIF